MLTLVVLDLRDDTVTLDIHLVFLDPSLPVFPLAVTGHALLVLPNRHGSLLVGEVVSDFAPYFDVLQASCSGFSCLLLLLFQGYLILGVWDPSIGLLYLLRLQVDQEPRHKLTRDEHLMTLGTRLLMDLKLIVELGGPRQVLVIDLIRVQRTELVL